LLAAHFKKVNGVYATKISGIYYEDLSGIYSQGTKIYGEGSFAAFYTPDILKCEAILLKWCVVSRIYLDCLNSK